jgi:hypothetical protein
VTSSRLPREVHDLLESSLGSIEKVEALRHLRRAPGSVPRDELMPTLRMDREAVDALLGELVGAGLVEAGAERDAVGLGPAARTPACEDLLQTYEEDRLAIVSELSALSMARIRNMAARTFSEAFVSRKKGQ